MRKEAKMTYGEAIKFIDPDTCVKAIEEAERHGDKVSVTEKMEEACRLACKALMFMDFCESDHFGFREAIVRNYK